MIRTALPTAVAALALSASASAAIVYQQDFNTGFTGSTGSIARADGTAFGGFGATAPNQFIIAPGDNSPQVAQLNTQGQNGILFAEIIFLDPSLNPDAPLITANAGDTVLLSFNAYERGPNGSPLVATIRIDGVAVATESFAQAGPDDVFAGANGPLVGGGTVTTGPLAAGGTVSISFRTDVPATDGFDQFQIEDFSIDIETAAIPEPASFGLLAAGIGVLSMKRRRR